VKTADKRYLALNPEDPSSFLDFDLFTKIPTLTDYTLVPIGYSLDVFNQYTNIVLMLWEEPNNFWSPQMEKTIRNNYNKIYKIISNCPRSTEYYNTLYNDDRRFYGFTPFDIKNLPSDFTKKHEVFFTGHVFSDFIEGIVRVVEKFNHCIVSFNYGNHRGASFKEKIKFNAGSKISVVWNCLYEISGKPMDELYPTHKSFQNLKKSKFIPQIKTRTLEAAACKSIMLCHFEDFRFIETQFTPDKDFIYWYNFNDLEEKINEILKNYDKYTYLAENAYNTLINNWTTYHFFEKYLRNL
jgi:hypothetical protein